MKEGLNRVTLIGNLGQDPELRYTQSGQAVMSMRMATTETFFNRDREKQERTEWHSVVLWGKRAEALSKFISKGQSLCVEGRLQTRQWEDKDGNRRYTTEVVANNVLLLGGGRGRTGDFDAPPPSDDYAPSDDQGPSGGGSGGDDDIPF